MKKFIVQLFSNRFGIVLAALNLCYFVSQNGDFVRQPLGRIFLSVNSAAGIASLLSVKFIEMFRHDLTNQMALANFFFVFFCALQWLLVAWCAKTLAASIHPKIQ